MRDEGESTGSAQATPGGDRTSGVDYEQARELDHELMEGYARVREQAGRFRPSRLFLESHIGREAERLRNEYINRVQAAADEPDLHEWLNDRIDDLKDYVETIRTPSSRVGRLFRGAKTSWTAAATAAVIVPPMLGLPITVASVSAAVVAGMHACFCEVFRWTLPALLVSVFIVGVTGFSSYRAILLGGGRRRIARGDDSANLFELEEELMRALGASRHGELQWDVLAWFAISGIWVAAIFIARAFHGEKTITFRVNPWILVGASAVLAVLFGIQSLSRKWGWRPTS